MGISWVDNAGQVAPALAVTLERAAGRRIDLVLLDDAPPLLAWGRYLHGIPARRAFLAAITKAAGV